MNTFQKILKERDEISVRYDQNNAAIWLYLNPKNTLGFPKSMLDDVYHTQLAIIDYFKAHNMSPKYPIRYLVFASQIPNVFNFGGDLKQFLEMIQKQDRTQFLEYAKLAVNTLYLNARSLDLPIITISLIEGQALGGGFETALSSNVLIAEKNVKMGFPDIKFNLFPGIGAYSFLARLIGPNTAEEMISSGKIYPAKELYEMGIIHQLCEEKNGKEAVENYMQKNTRFFHGLQAIQSVKFRYYKLDYQELLDIAEIWVDTALKLKNNNLKMMNRLVTARNNQLNALSKRLRTKHDRRWNTNKIDFPISDSKGTIINSERRKMDRRLDITQAVKYVRI